MDLSGKSAIVTGASSGIGAATVRKLRRGLRVNLDEIVIKALRAQSSGARIVRRDS